jgi:hypothetical protein
MSAEIDRTLSSVLGRPRAVEQPLALAVQVTELIGLKPIGKNAE